MNRTWPVCFQWQLAQDKVNFNESAHLYKIPRMPSIYSTRIWKKWYPGKLKESDKFLNIDMFKI